MKIDVGLITGSSISIDRDGELPVRLVQSEISEEEDVQTVELFRGSGIDACPVKDKANAVIVSIGSVKLAIAVDDAIVPDVSEGEIKVYSINPATNTISAYALFKVDGSIELNGNTDFAVAFTDLKTGFDQLKSDFNTFVTTIYNLHNHPTAPTGPVSVPSVVGSSTSASIDASKVDSVKVP